MRAASIERASADRARGARRERELARGALPRPAGVVEQRASVLELAQHLGQPVLDRLVGADRAAEREALLGVGDRHVERRLDAAERLGGDQRLREVPGARERLLGGVEHGRRCVRQRLRARASGSRRSARSASTVHAVGVRLDRDADRLAVAQRDADQHVGAGRVGDERELAARPALPVRSMACGAERALEAAGAGRPSSRRLQVVGRADRQVGGAPLAAGELLRASARPRRRRRGSRSPAGGRAASTPREHAPALAEHEHRVEDVEARRRRAPRRSAGRASRPRSRSATGRAARSSPSSASRAASSVLKRESAPRAASRRNTCSSESARFMPPPLPWSAAPRTGCPCPGAARAAARGRARRSCCAGSPRCRRPTSGRAGTRSCRPTRCPRRVRRGRARRRSGRRP